MPTRTPGAEVIRHALYGPELDAPVNVRTLTPTHAAVGDKSALRSRRRLRQQLSSEVRVYVHDQVVG